MAKILDAETTDSTGMYCFLGCMAYNCTDISTPSAWPGLSVFWGTDDGTAGTSGISVVPT